MSIYWATSMLVLIMLCYAMLVTKKKSYSYMNKWTQFECGFTVMTPSHLPFSFQFFLIALLFLIFDVEISLILAYPLETNMMKNLSIILLFLVVLTFGLLYEWQKSKIDWSKWMGLSSLQELKV